MYSDHRDRHVLTPSSLHDALPICKALEILDIDIEPPNYEPQIRPYTLLMIGVNGVGKTTTIGKLAARHVDAGRKTLMVAGDTFRAAAGRSEEHTAELQSLMRNSYDVCCLNNKNRTTNTKLI